MAKPSTNRQLSCETAHIYDDAEGIPENHWSRLFFSHVFSHFTDEQFAGMYKERGRYPVSPRFLACICILQSMFRASDRQAVENTIMRRDWRIALGIGRDYKGFCPTVLVRFRARLLAHDGAQEVFDTVIGRVEQLGLLRNRQRVRVDATHLLADVSWLSRCEMVREAIRVTVCDLYDRHPELHDRVDLLGLYDRYGEEHWLGPGRENDQTLIEFGRDAKALLALCGELAVKGKQELAQILEENYTFPEDGSPQPVEASELASDRIATPHDAELRCAKKGDKMWLGDKVHLVETADPGCVNFILDLLVTAGRVADLTVVERLGWRLRSRYPWARRLLADGGYAAAANSTICEALGIDLVCPPHPEPNTGLIPASEFNINFKERYALCPEGHRSCSWSPNGNKVNIRFPVTACRDCPRRDECTRSKRGRHMGISKDYEQLQRDRERAARLGHAAEYRNRAAIEGTISEAVRCCGLRRSRYRGSPKRRLHAYLAATALNVRRLLRALKTEGGPKKGPLSRVFGFCGLVPCAAMGPV